MTRWATLALLAACTVTPAEPPELPPTMPAHTLRDTTMTTSAGLVPLPTYDPDEDR